MRSLVVFVQEEFAWKKHGLHHDDREKFTKSQWPEFSGWKYPAYRVVLAAYFFVWFVISIVEGGGIIPGAGEDIDDLEQPNRPTTTPVPTTTHNETSPPSEYVPTWWWLVFLTNWTFALFNLYLIYSACSVTYYYLAERKKAPTADFTDQVSPAQPGKGLPLPLKLHWILFNLQVGLNPLVCVGFWTLIVPFDDNVENLLNVVSYHAHLLNGIVTIIDLFVVAIPVHLAHIYMTYFVGGAYIIASIIFWQTERGPFPIYGFLNYEDTPITTSLVLILVAVLVLPLMQLGIYGLYRLRLRIWRKHYGSGWPKSLFADKPVQSSFKSLNSF